MTIQEMHHWLFNEFISLLKKLNSEDKGKWGVMDAQQMVEHMSYSVRQATGKEEQKLLTPVEHLEKFRHFIVSEKQFRENTKNPGIPEHALPYSNASMQEAIDELKQEFTDFQNYFNNNPTAKLLNPVFGGLDYDLWIQLLYKHAMHHARQFGLI